jgi:glycerol-1-phosphate dehydrogenase [NAD(P)+]
VSNVVRLSPEPFVLDIGHGALEHLGSVLSEKGIAVDSFLAVVVGEGLGSQITEQVSRMLVNAEVLLARGGTLDDAEQLAAHVVERGHIAVIGIGGGRTLDTAKLAAARAAVPMVAVATSLAHDGLASPVAILEHDGRRHSYAAAAPTAVIVDLDFVRSAPPQMVRAGVGDLISNLVAVADWELAHEARGEQVNGLAVMLSRTAAESVLHRTDLDSDAFYISLAEALVVSGLAMLVAGSSRPCSGSDHEISHAIDHLYPGTAAHGEQVGVGTLFSMFLRGDEERAAQVDACLRRHGLARVPRDLGLTAAQFTKAVLDAPTTRPDRYTILEHLDLDAEATRDVVDRFNERYDRAEEPSPLLRVSGDS